MDEAKTRECLSLMNNYGFAIGEAYAVVYGGENYEDVRAKKVKHEKSFALLEKKNSEWPMPKVIWDLAPEHWHLSMDGHDVQSFRLKFPDAAVMSVKTSQLSNILAAHSRRLGDPFSPNYRSKSAALVVHLQEGGRVSPAMTLLDAGGLHVVGGNHRLGWAMYLKQEEIPILIRSLDRKEIEELLKT
ncbi:hypothetical protein JMM61_19320 [Rhodovulum sulfidophilum]|uniref:hypothetical protein n=1 Tax=Rhodovulum sulfidophilum TaxID=35806 RepID=UPI0019263BD3|nr:hypothetical protein [Rhodovulum sulfidophilum]MBL3587495.1 hypothetical protein [Rhodovulum sulfidophilum]